MTPDSALAREAEELLRSAAPDFLTNHSFRCYAWAVEFAAADRVRFDAELLYVAALLHDIGLLGGYDTGRCFEEDGARVASDLAAVQGWTVERREALAAAIRLHTALEMSLEKDGPESYLLWQAAAADVVGHRFDGIDREQMAAVLSLYPRLGFARGFTELLADQAARKSGCWANRAIEGGIAVRIASSPFDRPDQVRLQ